MRRHLAATVAAVVIDRDDHDVRWVAPQNLHVTLKFLGEVSDAELPSVIDVLRKVPPVGSLELELLGLGAARTCTDKYARQGLGRHQVATLLQLRRWSLGRRSVCNKTQV